MILFVVEDFQVTEDPNFPETEIKEDPYTQYIIYSMVGVLFCVGICCIGVYCLMKSNHRKAKLNAEYDKEVRKNTLETKSTRPHHEVVPSVEEYRIRKEMEIAQLNMPSDKKSTTPPSTAPQLLAPNMIEKVDSLDQAVSKPLPVSRTPTVMKPDEEDAPIINKDSTIFYDPTEDARFYGKTARHNVQVTAVHMKLPKGMGTGVGNVGLHNKSQSAPMRNIPKENQHGVQQYAPINVVHNYY